MMITPDSLVHYLLQRGYMSFDSVVDGDLIVLEASRRNRNFKVIRKNHPGFFIKQVMQSDPQAMATLQRESVCYWLAQSTPEFSSLLDIVPKYYAFDPLRQLLILELVRDGETLADLHRRLGKFPPNTAAGLARVLGRYHRHTESQLQKNPQTSVFPKMVPWVLSIHQQQPAWFSSLSAANLQLLQIVQTYPEFSNRLDDLRGRWRVDCLIHGDMKWDNCLVAATTSSENNGVNFKIVDWEMADFGDALWDVGAILQSYISYWILSMPAAEGITPAELVGGAPYPLESMQPAIRSFWETYARTVGMTSVAAKEALERSACYAAARMIQTAVECLTFADKITANALYLLQVSVNILQNPPEAIRELLGIKEA